MNEDPKIRMHSPPPTIEGEKATLLEERAPEIGVHPAFDLQLDPHSKAPPSRERRAALSPILGYLEVVSRAARSQVDSARQLISRVKGGGVLVSFLAFVIAPSFATVIYFAFIAADQFTAQARFAVRQIEADSEGSTFDTTSAAPTGINFAFTLAGQNDYIVTSYIQSRAVVDGLNAKMDLREIFRRPEADFWARLKKNASIEELVDYWYSMISTSIDAQSGIVTLQVRAFRPQDAVAIASAVLDLSQTLVNHLSDRARRDAVASSEKEVQRTYELTQVALADMQRYRNSSGIIDPVQAGSEIGKLLMPLLTEKIRLEGALFVASRDLDDTAPTIKALKSQLTTTEQQISALRAKLTNSDGGGDNTLAASLAKFEELDLKRQFAERLYTLAQADLDRARQRAERQSIYLTVFVPPSPPQESNYPRRIAFSIIVFVGLTILWGIGAMTIASVEDHRL